MKIDSVKHIAIIGTGMIATSIAVMATGHGYKTTLLAMNDDLAAESRKSYKDFYGDMINHGLITKEQAEICEKYLNYTLSYNDISDANVVFEAVIEVLDVKHAVYAEIEKNCPDVKAVCSVSSAIVVDDLASAATKYKDRIIVTHPFNPVHMVPYFEIAIGECTADGVAQFAKDLLTSMDRKPVILKKSAPGFIGNRLQFALWREAVNIYESGIAAPEDIDTCLMYSFSPRYTSIGIYEHFDNGGLELNRNVCRTIFPTLSNESNVPKSIEKLIEEGNLGRKTGKGFYDWTDVDPDKFRERVSAPYWKFINWDFPKN